VSLVLVFPLALLYLFYQLFVNVAVGCVFLTLYQTSTARVPVSLTTRRPSLLIPSRRICIPAASQPSHAMIAQFISRTYETMHGGRFGALCRVPPVASAFPKQGHDVNARLTIPWVLANQTDVGMRGLHRNSWRGRSDRPGWVGHESSCGLRTWKMIWSAAGAVEREMRSQIGVDLSAGVRKRFAKWIGCVGLHDFVRYVLSITMRRESIQMHLSHLLSTSLPKLTCALQIINIQ